MRIVENERASLHFDHLHASERMEDGKVFGDFFSVFPEKFQRRQCRKGIVNVEDTDCGQMKDGFAYAKTRVAFQDVHGGVNLFRNDFRRRIRRFL